MSFSVSSRAPAEVQRVVRDIEDEINRLRGLTGEKGVFPMELAEVRTRLARTNASLESSLKQVTAHGTRFNIIEQRMNATENVMAFKVGNDEVVSSINLSPESIRIASSRIEIDGATTFLDPAYDPSRKAQTFRQAGAPADDATNDLKIGDVWIDSDDSERMYVWNGTGWVEAAATDPNAAGSSGNVVIRATTSPSARNDGSSLQIGDLWLDSDDGDRPYVWNGTSWLRAYTSIEGGDIVTGSVTLQELAFTPLESTSGAGDIIATINASGEGLNISASKIHISGSTTFSSGYDPSAKLGTGEAANDINTNSTTIDGGKITTGSVTANKLDVDGTIALSSGGVIRSSSFTAGSNGWRIRHGGDAEFNDVIVRGLLVAADAASYIPSGGSFEAVGSLTWANGVGLLDQNGMEIDVGTTLTSNEAISWVSGSTSVARLWTRYSSGNAYTRLEEMVSGTYIEINSSGSDKILMQGARHIKFQFGEDEFIFDVKNDYIDIRERSNNPGSPPNGFVRFYPVNGVMRRMDSSGNTADL